MAIAAMVFAAPTVMEAVLTAEDAGARLLQPLIRAETALVIQTLGPTPDRRGHDLEVSSERLPWPTDEAPRPKGPEETGPQT